MVSILSLYGTRQDQVGEMTVVTLVIVLILVAVIVIGGLGVIIVWLVKSQYRTRRFPSEITLEVSPDSAEKISTCARCNERRLIVSPSDGLCASCYSALRTKRLE